MVGAKWFHSNEFVNNVHLIKQLNLRLVNNNFATFKMRILSLIYNLFTGYSFFIFIVVFVWIFRWATSLSFKLTEEQRNEGQKHSVCKNSLEGTEFWDNPI